MARKFLYAVAIMVVLALGALAAYRIWAPDLLRLALTPSVPFKPPPEVTLADYDNCYYWWTRSGHSCAFTDENGIELNFFAQPMPSPADWLPPGIAPAPAGPAAVFFVPGTSFIDRSAWNAPWRDAQSDRLARKRLDVELSVFAPAGAVWAPRYRQATQGAFLTDKPERLLAFAAAYRDVRLAFRTFLAANPQGPIVLAGHGQGSFHLLRLWREEVRGTPIAQRLVALYAPGWPIVRTGAWAGGPPPCATPDQTGCLLTWQSYAEPMDRSLEAAMAARTEGPGAGGANPRPDQPFATLCTNPLGSGRQPATANPGSLIPDADYRNPVLKQGVVGAHCTADGALSVGPPPNGYASFALPGNDFTLYDYAFFWAALRADVSRRTVAFSRAHLKDAAARPAPLKSEGDTK